MKNFSQVSRSPGRDLDREPSIYKAVVLTNRLRSSLLELQYELRYEYVLIECI
jgi:hypothetical protein